MYNYINPVTFKIQLNFFTDRKLLYHKIAKSLIFGGFDFDLNAHPGYARDRRNESKKIENLIKIMLGLQLKSENFRLSSIFSVLIFIIFNKLTLETHLRRCFV